MRTGFLRIAALLIILGSATGTLMGQAPTQDPPGKFFDLTIGLGINAHFTHSVANYINQVAQPGLDQKIGIIVSAPEFFASAELQLTDDWSAGIEYSLLVKSYAIRDRSGYARSDFSYQVHMPAVVIHRLVFGEGYRVKFGGGIGYYFCSFRQQFQPYGNDETLKADGPGLKLEAVGNTKFDDTFYGSIGVDLRWGFLGTLERGDAVGAGSRAGELPSMSFFNAGIKFGLTFQLSE